MFNDATPGVRDQEQTRSLVSDVWAHVNDDTVVVLDALPPVLTQRER